MKVVIIPGTVRFQTQRYISKNLLETLVVSRRLPFVDAPLERPAVDRPGLAVGGQIQGSLAPGTGRALGFCCSAGTIVALHCQFILVEHMKHGSR